MVRVVVNGVGAVFVCARAGVGGAASDVPRLGLLILGCERSIACGGHDRRPNLPLLRE